SGKKLRFARRGGVSSNDPGRVGQAGRTVGRQLAGRSASEPVLVSNTSPEDPGNPAVGSQLPVRLSSDRAAGGASAARRSAGDPATEVVTIEVCADGGSLPARSVMRRAAGEARSSAWCPDPLLGRRV